MTAPRPTASTALHWAARADRVELVQALIRAGAPVNAMNRYGVTPLSLAAVNGSAAVVDALLEAGADANTVGADGETVLMIAARTGRPGRRAAAARPRRDRQRARDAGRARRR